MFSVNSGYAHLWRYEWLILGEEINPRLFVGLESRVKDAFEVTEVLGSRPKKSSPDCWMMIFYAHVGSNCVVSHE